MFVIIAGVLVNLNNVKTVSVDQEAGILEISYPDGTITEITGPDVMDLYKQVIKASGANVEIGGSLVV